MSVGPGGVESTRQVGARCQLESFWATTGLPCDIDVRVASTAVNNALSCAREINWDNQHRFEQIHGRAKTKNIKTTPPRPITISSCKLEP
jgi:hypothetical protein